MTVEPGFLAVVREGSRDTPRVVASCNRPGCTGEILEGYCDLCGLAPMGAGRPAVPPVPSSDPRAAILAHPEVPEAHRFCGQCQRPVGRSWPGKPGRLDGFCPRCGHPYSFRPKLRAGDVVGDHYEVVGCMNHGRLGWIYLAMDRSASNRWVVLEGLVDSGDTDAIQAAISNHQFLAEIEHLNIVRIDQFVQQEDAGCFIVEEYLGGTSLQDVRRQFNDETGEPIPVAQAIAFMLEVLPALGYLHGRNLLYCDLKPEEIIQTGQQVKLVGLACVRRMDDDISPLCGTVGFQAPEVAELGPSVSSDLYTVARTLAILTLDVPGFQDVRRYATCLPPAAEVPVFTHYDSFHRFLVKGTNPGADKRFKSAEVMAEQLLGVLREVVALDGDGTPVQPPPSKQFGPAPFASPDEADWRSLPVPNLHDAADPQDPLPAGPSDAIRARDPSAPKPAPMTPQAGFRLAQAHINAGELDRAELTLLSIAARGYTDWPLRWWIGVRALAARLYQLAAEEFNAACTELPGELAPKLALAYALELAGDVQEASRHYATITMTDPDWANASFGLARCRLQQRDRTGAAAALQAVPATSGAHAQAQAMLCRVLSEVADGWVPTLQDLVSASEAVEGIPEDAETRARLSRDLLLSVLAMLRDGTLPPSRTEPVAVIPPTKV